MANSNNTTLHFLSKYIAFYKTQWSLFLDSSMWDCYALKKLIIFDSARRRGEEMAKRAKKEVEKKKICESFFLAIAFFWFFGTWVKLPAAAPNDALLLWIALKFVSFHVRAIKRNARDFLFCAMANCMGKKCFFLLVGEINKTFTTTQHNHTEPQEWDGRELGFFRGRKKTLHCNNVRLHCWRLELLVFWNLKPRPTDAISLCILWAPFDVSGHNIATTSPKMSNSKADGLLTRPLDTNSIDQLKFAIDRMRQLATYIDTECENSQQIRSAYRRCISHVFCVLRPFDFWRIR